jgi:hypothetical protein
VGTKSADEANTQLMHSRSRGVLVLPRGEEEIQARATFLRTAYLEEEEAARRADRRLLLRDVIIRHARTIDQYRRNFDAIKTLHATDSILFCLEQFQLSAQIFAEFFDYHSQGTGDAIRKNIETWTQKLIKNAMHKEELTEATGKTNIKATLAARPSPTECDALLTEFKKAHVKAKGECHDKDPTLSGLLRKYSVQIERLVQTYQDLTTLAHAKTADPLPCPEPSDRKVKSEKSEQSTHNLVSFFQGKTMGFSQLPSSQNVQTKLRILESFDLPTELRDIASAVMEQAIELEQSASRNARYQAFFLLWRFLEREPIGLERSHFFRLLAERKILLLQKEFNGGESPLVANRQNQPTTACHLDEALTRVRCLGPLEELNRLFPQRLEEKIALEGPKF